MGARVRDQLSTERVCSWLMRAVLPADEGHLTVSRFLLLEIQLLQISVSILCKACLHLSGIDAPRV